MISVSLAFVCFEGASQEQTLGGFETVCEQKGMACSNKTLFTKAGGRLDWVYGSWFANPCLEERTWASDLDSSLPPLLALLRISCATFRCVTVSLTLVWIMQMIILIFQTCSED